MRRFVVEGEMGLPAIAYARMAMCAWCDKEFEAIKIGHRGRYPGFCCEQCRKFKRHPPTGRPRGRPRNEKA